ncbi:MAG: hypothetical protein U1F68_06260 [Gammaproteobacteria bacterium]
MTIAPLRNACAMSVLALLAACGPSQDEIARKALEEQKRALEQQVQKLTSDQTAAQEKFTELDKTQQGLQNELKTAKNALATVTAERTALATEQGKQQAQIAALVEQLNQANGAKDQVGGDKARLQTELADQQSRHSLVGARLATVQEDSYRLESQLRAAVAARDATLSQLKALEARLALGTQRLAEAEGARGAVGARLAIAEQDIRQRDDSIAAFQRQFKAESKTLSAARDMAIKQWQDLQDKLAETERKLASLGDAKQVMGARLAHIQAAYDQETGALAQQLAQATARLAAETKSLAAARDVAIGQWQSLQDRMAHTTTREVELLAANQALDARLAEAQQTSKQLSSQLEGEAERVRAQFSGQIEELTHARDTALKQWQAVQQQLAESQASTAQMQTQAQAQLAEAERQREALSRNQQELEVARQRVAALDHQLGEANAELKRLRTDPLAVLSLPAVDSSTQAQQAQARIAEFSQAFESLKSQLEEIRKQLQP